MIKRNYLNYIAIFLIILGLYFFCKSFASAEIPVQDEYFFQHMKRTTVYKTRQSTSEQRIKWQEEYEFHMFQAIRTYNDAKDKCWWLPDITERDRARMCWTTAVSVLACPTPQGKLIVCVTQLLIQYGLDVIDEWDYIKDKLAWSKFHFDECERLQQLLQR